MPYIENRDRWEQLAEIDYLGAFANAWLAFNAWYRSAYQEQRDRDIIEKIKNYSNSLRSSIEPMIASPSEDGEQLRANIGLLHHRLENYHIYNTQNDISKRITLEDIYLRHKPFAPQNKSIYGLSYSVNKVANDFVCTVKAQNGTASFRFVQQRYDIAKLEAALEISTLSPTQRGHLLSVFYKVNPKQYANLLNNGQTPIECGAYQFACTKDDLFAGVVEAIYLMRCTFFHGELVPTRDANLCYEPAYHLVRRFLQSIS